jgi:hypothetical protein
MKADDGSKPEMVGKASHLVLYDLVLIAISVIRAVFFSASHAVHEPCIIVFIHIYRTDIILKIFIIFKISACITDHFLLSPLIYKMNCHPPEGGGAFSPN